ncbi:glycerophosphoryl diester phosphodiesterase membrane domain-containing protein [Streptomyces roseoverticillatus]|uniref:glycerophosphoryl diester phosphodiesterase membrane domain-containing protein n=1 Tax=Streptomyces roseoverticillatus TaxID=66429 RepID=UPI001F284F72|nr:glycerophosphoryl diester phosphodiesterase membrane domain-containing protein [Streptomyces roseoverticillatus]MCF3104524.1 glycerophosphoryl diester phosphodiesterase membrane domain-containing protein [Streptomyces roseoverticillatus]
MTDSPGRTSPGSSPSEETDKADKAAEAAQEGRPAQWAQEQPPPGDWSASAQGPPRQRRGTGERARAQTGPGPGHGGAGGVPGQPGQPGPQAGRQHPGRPQWGRPQAPQPGVIPLRPLQAGEIVEGAVRTMRIHWRAVLGISLTVAVGTQAVATVVDRLWDRGTPELDPLGGATPETPQELVGAIGNGLGGIGVAWLLSLVGSITAAALLTVIVSRAVLGRPVTAREAWWSARPQLGRMAGLMVLVPMLLIGVFAVGIVWGLLVAAAGAEQAGMSLTALGGLAAMVVATWLWIRYSLAAPALMLEKQGVAAAMQRSAKLVRGSWWRVFGIQLISILITALVGLMAQAVVLVFDVFIHGGGGQSVADATDWASLIEIGIAAVVSSALTLPVSAGMTALLYMDQRIRRESLDVELARSASEGK